MKRLNKCYLRLPSVLYLGMPHESVLQDSPAVPHTANIALTACLSPAYDAHER